MSLIRRSFDYYSNSSLQSIAGQGIQTETTRVSRERHDLKSFNLNANAIEHNESNILHENTNIGDDDIEMTSPLSSLDNSTYKNKLATKRKQLGKLRNAQKKTLMWKKKAMQRKLVINNSKRQLCRMAKSIAKLKAEVNAYKLDSKISKKAVNKLEVQMKKN